MSGKHHEFSPSKLKNLESCPCFVGSDEETEYSKEGSMLHEMCYKRSIDGLSESHKELVSFAMDAVLEIIGFHGKPVESYLELPLQIYNDDGIVITEGTADVVMVYDDYVIVCDYKFGYSFVSAYDNPQLQAYGAGACQKFGKDKMFTYIIQPRCNYVGCDERKLAYCVNRIKTIIDACKHEDKKPCPDADACRYCVNKLKCEGTMKAQNDLVMYSDKQIANMEPDEVADIFDKLLVVKKMLDKIERECKKYAEDNGDKIGDRYEYQERNGKTKPIPVAKALTVLSLQEIKDDLSISKTALEEAYVNKYYRGRGKGKPTKKALKDEFKAKTNGIIEYGKPWKQLVEVKK